MRKWPVFLLLVLLLGAFSFLFADEDENEPEEPLPIGNFSVPLATQIAPLVSFGQLLIGKNALLPQLTGAYIHTHHGSSDIIAPSVIYGLRDDLSLFFAVPFNTRSRSGPFHSSGIGDVLLQLEYGYYQKTHRNYTL